MLRTKTLLGFSLTILAGCLFCSNALAATPNGTTQVEEYTGSVSILPNAARKETTIALTLSYARDAMSNQIVFHVQETAGNVPSQWRGPARVFAGDGVLAILPKDPSRGWLFKFPNRQRPSSFDGMSFEEYSAYGIARYGETRPLTASQIERLVSTGQPNPTIATCVAGGPGATSCSCGDGSQAVTCPSGSYAQCTIRTAACVQAKPE